MGGALYLSRHKPSSKKSLYQPINKAIASMMDKRCTTCGKRSSGWGFKPEGETLNWFCTDHRSDGEKYLGVSG